jgi:rsbT co-antagonist protein RsbR
MSDSSIPESETLIALRARVEELETELGRRTRSEERVRALLTGAVQLIWVCDAAGEVHEDSPTWRAFTGQSWDEYRGRGWLDALHPDDRARGLAAWSVSVAKKERHHIEHRVRRRDGVYRLLEVQAAPVLDASGAVREWVGACVDVTEAREAEAALRRSEERFRALSERLPVGVFQLSVDMANGKTSMEFVNDRWYEICGFPRVSPEEASLLQLIHPDDLAASTAKWGAALVQGAPVEIEQRIVRPDGEVRWIRITALPLRCETGELIAYLGALQDITEGKQIEGLLRETVAQKEIIEAQRIRLAETSTPLIPITDEIMVMPLVGEVDRERADQVLETLLGGIASTGARVAILDVTGLVGVDVAVASALVRAAQAARLLGAQAVLSGIRPEMARTLVEISAEVGAMATFGNLKAAIAHGMRAVRAGR